MKLARVTCIVTAAIVVAPASASAALPASARISTAGLGPVKIGMTEAQVERAVGSSIQRDGPGGDCTTGEIARRTFGLFTGSRLARIYVQTARFATTRGIRVGDSDRKLLAAYPGKLRRVKQFYGDGFDRVLMQGNRKLLFGLSAGKVGSISTGRRPEIDLVEGCS